jgi:hypothetical protein
VLASTQQIANLLDRAGIRWPAVEACPWLQIARRPSGMRVQRDFCRVVSPIFGHDLMRARRSGKP